MRILTRRGRLTVTLVVVAVLAAGALTWTSGSELYVAACVVCAGVVAVGAAIFIDDFDHALRSRQVTIWARKRIQ